MLWKSKDLKGSRLAASDGEVGHLKDLYFDDDAWTVRYLVADTGNWLPQRKVLISPHAVGSVHATPHKAVEVKLTRQQIEDSPPIEAHKPVSRHHEAQYLSYYGWPLYWPGPLLWGPVAFPGMVAPNTPVPQVAPPEPVKPEDSHLRSVAEVSGYSIQALDYHFGHVDQFIIDDRDWAIRYIVADTRTWWPGKRVLIAPQWISSVSWREMSVYIDLDRETVKRSPEYNPDAPLTREYEAKLFEHYNREPYWESATAKL